MQTIDREKLRSWLQEGRKLTLVEVLDKEQFDQFHLPGAINVPLGGENFEERFERAVPDKTEPVVVYCANTECDASPRAARKLEAYGYQDVRDYEAGKADWKKAGLPIEEAA
ncbi:MAG TPA: rhodanese-like domain-containing protein [Rhodocyclaceae bacterium]|nr:rhodanese-like domain-containing protein [Rhodocyclaceae bacterium]